MRHILPLLFLFCSYTPLHAQGLPDRSLVFQEQIDGLLEESLLGTWGEFDMRNKTFKGCTKANQYIGYEEDNGKYLTRMYVSGKPFTKNGREFGIQYSRYDKRAPMGPNPPGGHIFIMYSKNPDPYKPGSFVFTMFLRGDFLVQYSSEVVYANGERSKNTKSQVYKRCD